MTDMSGAWYPDPQDASLLRWYDGTQWTQHTAPARPYALPARPPLGSGWFTLSGWLQALLALLVPVNLAAAGVGTYTATVMGTWLRHPEQATEGVGARIDTLQLTAYVTQFGLYAIAGVVFVTWLYRAHRSDRMQARSLKHGSGWAIGGWFVPILNLWRPRQIVQDVRVGCSGDEGPRSNLVVNLWWTAFVVANVTSQVSTLLAPGEDVPDEDLVVAMRRSATSDTVDGVVTAAAAVLAVLLVREVTRRVRDSPLGSR